MNVLRESCHKRINELHVASNTAKSLYYYVQWTGHFICREDFLIDRRNFTSFLLMYTVKGSGTLFYEGRKYKLSEGSTMLIDCVKHHRYYPNADGWEFKYIHFNGSFAADYYRYITSLHSSVVIDGIDGAEAAVDEVIKLTQTHGREERCSDIIYHYLIGLISLGEDEKNESCDGLNVKDVLNYIAENYQREIDVSLLAEKFHLSRSHFSVEFKKNTGFTPYNYILNYRIAAAKRMLHTTERSVEDISESCGFSSPSSFIRAFKRMVGMSPAVFRENGG